MLPLISRAIHKGKSLHRRLTSGLRLLPNFIIIGGQRCGTTSLYRYLSGHPLVEPSLWKEVHYFDLNYDKGLGWYRAQFPLAAPLKYGNNKKTGFITGEASPYYMFHPHAPKRAAALVPKAKLIVLLRDPVARAYSHFHHEKKMGREPLAFGEAIDYEEERLTGELTKMLEDESYYSHYHHRHAYLARGIYIDQVLKWEKYFDRSQFLVVNSEELFSRPHQTFSQILGFLELTNWHPAEFKRHNLNNYPGINAKLKQRLSCYFEPHNKRLYEHLRTPYDW